MHMWFWTSYNVGTLLFDGLVIKSVWGLIAVCLGLGALSFFFEFLRYLQTVHRQRELLLRSKQLKNLQQGEISTLLPHQKLNILDRQAGVIPLKERALMAASDFILWFSILIIAYFLMLAVMTYNLWIFLSVLSGGGLGYYVFGQMFMKVNLQNCKIIQDLLCKTQCESGRKKEGESPTTEAENVCESGPSRAPKKTTSKESILPSSVSSGASENLTETTETGHENTVVVHAENS